MDSSKLVYISLEDLLYGIFTILLSNEKKLEISYDQINEYENEVINYLQERNYEIIVDNSSDVQERFFSKHHEFIKKEDKIILLHYLFLIGKEIIDQNKKNALFNENAIEIFEQQKQLIK